MLQKHRYTVKAEECGNSKLIRGYEFQPDRRGSQEYNIWGRSIQVPSTAGVPVRKQLASSQKEYLEGKVDLGTDGENLEAGSSGSNYFGGVLLRGGTYSATLWSIDMVPHVFYEEDT